MALVVRRLGVRPASSAAASDARICSWRLDIALLRGGSNHFENDDEDDRDGELDEERAVRQQEDGRGWVISALSVVIASRRAGGPCGGYCFLNT